MAARKQARKSNGRTFEGDEVGHKKLTDAANEWRRPVRLRHPRDKVVRQVAEVLMAVSDCAVGKANLSTFEHPYRDAMLCGEHWLECESESSRRDKCLEELSAIARKYLTGPMSSRHYSGRFETGIDVRHTLDVLELAITGSRQDSEFEGNAGAICALLEIATHFGAPQVDAESRVRIELQRYAAAISVDPERALRRVLMAYSGMSADRARNCLKFRDVQAKREAARNQ